MFEHLDDPQPYTPPPGLRSGVLHRVRRRRRRQVAVAGGVATIAAVGVGSVVAVRERLEPQRIEVGGLATAPDGEADAVDAEGVPAPGDPVTFLVVGTDRGVFTEEGRADTIGLVRLDPTTGEIRLLTVPRDLLLSDEGFADRRAAQVFAERGPEGLIRGLGRTLDVEVDHYVEVDFPGAVELVDAIGGIRVAVDRPVRDDGSGLVLAAGCQELDGATALALGRSRRPEVQQPDGSWVSDTAVFGRDARGAAVAAALVQAVGRAGPDDLPGLVAVGLDSVTVDADLATDDLETWAREAADDRFVPLGLPVTDSGDAATLRLDEGADEVVAAFVDGGTGPVPALADGAPWPEPTGLRPC